MFGSNMLPSAKGRQKKRTRNADTGDTGQPSSVDVTPKRIRKKQKIRRRSRMPDPCQSTSNSITSSESSLSLFVQKASTAKKQLHFISPTTTITHDTVKVWTEEETKSLVNYIRCQGYSEAWPVSSKNTKLWESAADFLDRCTAGTSRRTGNACRHKVFNSLRKKFKTPEQAEFHYFPNKLVTSEPTVVVSEMIISPSLTPSTSHLPPHQQLQLISNLFSEYCSSHSTIVIEDDFLRLAISAMEQLKSCGRSNVVYGLSKVLGTKRKDQSDSLLPSKRMPMGLIEHCVNFFSSSSTREATCPDDYRQWLVSMFSLFGTKFVKLFSGPMWRVETTAQENQAPLSQGKIPVEARTNVPGLSERTLQRDIASSGILTGAGIQTLLLDEAAKTSDRNTTWWIKADGCDIVPGLCESVQQKWSGDVDLNNGELQANYQLYTSKLDFVSGLALGTRREKGTVLSDLTRIHQQLLQDKDFALKELSSADARYHEKLQSNDKDSKSLFSVGWKVEELTLLVDRCQTCIASTSSIFELVADSTSDLVGSNVPRRLSTLRELVKSFIKDLSRHQRDMATHIFVLMISSELRDTKPYAIPVQCLPYHSMKHQQVRQIVSTLVKEMGSRGMRVSGYCTDGEFNSLRNQGYTRPLSLVKIRNNVRSKYAKTSKQRMMKMLTPKRSETGQFISGEISNPSVSKELLLEISQWLDQGIEWNDVLQRLRPRTVPPGYTFTNWRPAEKEETQTDMLRSILAQLEFAHIVREYDDRGVKFRSHLHVPEVHPLTKEVFLEREDEGHVLKRIAQCTRNGGPQRLQLDRFVEALHSPQSGLTYAALVGSRKQSVEDAERLFSPSLLKYMQDKGYDYEAGYIEAVLGWRQACDQRGLSEFDRSRRNFQMLTFLLEELMPWYKDTYDFSLMEVNRDISNVCGFTREVLTALIANIETREWRRCKDPTHPEHPRASTTDDVECFFSVMRDLVGANFTLKQAQFAWRKVCVEFRKRISVDLPFYYFTSAHDRFYEGPRVSFNERPRETPKPKRLPRGEQLASFSSGRATLPVRGTLTVRPKFHKHPVSVPPPVNAAIHSTEHSYSHPK